MSDRSAPLASAGGRGGIGARERSAADLSIHHLLRARSKRTPDAIAVTAPEREPLTYRALFLQVDRTVTRLRELGIGCNDRTAVVLPNGPELAVAFLAVASAATCAPLNPAYTVDEFDFYLSDLDARALIVQSAMDSPARAVAENLDIPVIELSPAFAAQAGIFAVSGGDGSRVSNDGLPGPDDVALVLHTSGTTSRPKIVPLTHANLCTSALNIKLAFSLTIHDRCLNVMPLFHVHGLVGAVLSTLASGASVVCTPGFDADRFFHWLDTFCPTWYTAVPTMHQAILERASAYRGVIARRPLRFIRSCSASLPPRVMVELEDVFSAPVLESYGMTEAAHQVTSNLLPPQERKAGSVGVPTGPAVAIMDETGDLLPAGDKGEIVIRGANVTRGYEGSAGTNAAAFTGGWFRTGDQGFLDEDGYLFITGRIKEIINRGGEKIAPREVEEVLLDHPAVAQAVTFAAPHPTLGEDVAAAVVLREDGSVTEQELRELAFARLANHKVPTQVVFLEEIPKGATGKLQRIGLAEKLRAELRGDFVAPRGPAERALARLWAEVLNIGRVGARDNFFALGGDSLRATQLVARVRAAFGVELPVAATFREPTLADQALAIEELLIDQLEDLDEEEARPVAE